MNDPVMSAPNPEDRDPRDPILQACRRFEEAWGVGPRPRLEDFLGPDDDPRRAELLRALLACEVRLRSLAGESPRPDEYRDRFPDHLDLIEEVIDRTLSELTVLHSPDLSRFGRFEILRQLGRGGQATTYLARDTDLDYQVVLKVYHALRRDDLREAALAEGRALVRVKSPYVARCLGVESEGDRLALVVEYVAGRDLSQVPRDELRDPRRLALIIEQAAEGLAELHRCGLLHRDIKPQNILLGHDGSPRLVDLGLAAPFASDALHHLSGSPPYMSPEQADGRGEHVGPRTDVFGLGAVLYTLLAGRPPYRGSNQKETLDLARHARYDPPRVHEPGVDRSLERITLKAMAADPRARYGSATELARVLERYRIRQRLTAPALGVAAVAVPLLFWAVWASTREPGKVAEVEMSQVRPDPRATTPRIESLRIRYLPEGYLDRARPLREGLNAPYAARLGDHVQIEAKLLAPGYAYLIAFRSDGEVEVCHPLGEDETPRPTRTPNYPPPTIDESYVLEEGAGMYAFVLIVSHDPLPPFRDWSPHLTGGPWRAGIADPPGVAWSFDGQFTTPHSAADPSGTRGKGGRPRGGGSVVSELAAWLRSLPGVDELAIEAFVVEPRPGEGT